MEQDRALYASQLEECLYRDAPFYDWMHHINEDQEFATKLLYEVLNQNRSDQTVDTTALIDFLAAMYRMPKENDVELIVHFFDQSRGNDIAGVFLSDEQISSGLKNKYLFELIEMIRFAKMQKQNLSDAQSYNRHIEKSLADMKTALIVLFELQTSYAELDAILHKYYELTGNVNTAKFWTRFHSLYKYPAFEHFLNEIKSELIATYRRGGFKTEALKFYIETEDPVAIDAYMRTLMETAADNRKYTNEMISCNVAFPFDDEFLMNVVALFAEDTDHMAALNYMRHQTIGAAKNVVSLRYDVGMKQASEDEFTSILADMIQKKNVTYELRNWI